MKKVIKSKSIFSDTVIIFTVDEELNKLKGKNLAPKKLAAANEILRRTPIEQIDKLRQKH